MANGIRQLKSQQMSNDPLPDSLFCYQRAKMNCAHTPVLASTVTVTDGEGYRMIKNFKLKANVVVKIFKNTRHVK